MRPGVPRPLSAAALALALAGCSAATVAPPAASPGPSPSATATAAASVGPSQTAPTPTPAGPFQSAFYGYTFEGPGWSGVSATAKWDGSGAPGDGDPVVDTLSGPLHHSFAFGEPTTLGLDAFADALNAANATVHPCPQSLQTHAATIDGAPARIDVCPGPVPVWTAYVIKAGRAVVIVDYEPVPEQAADLPTAFPELLQGIKLD